MSFFCPRYFLALVSAVFILSPRAFCEVGDKVPGCRIVFEASKEQFLHELDAVERNYREFRWFESRIRIHEYEFLWDARTRSNHPVSQEIRQSGQRDETWLLKELKRLDDFSKDACNRVRRDLIGLQNLRERFESCCPDPDVQDCLGEASEKVMEELSNGIRIFDSVFEYEKQFRKSIGNTIGGREGLYPLDTVEPFAEHGDYFSRYEQKKRHDLFDQDHAMANFFLRVRKLLTDAYSGDDCCLRCGKTDWEKTEERFFK